MHKFLKIFSLGSENHSQKTSKPDVFSHEKHFLWRGMPVGTMKSQKTHRIFKKSQKHFQKHKFLKFLFDLAELPMVSLGQEPLGGANHSQKTSKSGGVFPANHLL